MNTKTQISILTMTIMLLAPTLPAAMEVRQETVEFHMATTQDMVCETFVITGSPLPQKAPQNTCHSFLLHFQKGSSTLIPAEASSFLSGLQKCRIIQDTPLTITGYTCELGPDQLNQTLSLQRANTVANLLRNRGYTVATVQGKGSLNPVSHDPQRLSNNRRVKIEVIH
ncbi:OmpA family protein [Myxococcota bacterium]|nr:OmpA family protein [Myxococcota bacterium]MBU1413902.1 OmpA family protein [Myxococcota bacterium]